MLALPGRRLNAYPVDQPHLCCGSAGTYSLPPPIPRRPARTGHLYLRRISFNSTAPNSAKPLPLLDHLKGRFFLHNGCARR